jgi:hypothetical protein
MLNELLGYQKEQVEKQLVLGVKTATIAKRLGLLHEYVQKYAKELGYSQ